jgi:16S rRNA (guanine(527)-N(7))-methyltransferase RsmG
VNAQKAGVLVSAEAMDLLEAYFSLLVKWNAKINLTALPLQPPTDDTVHRLFIEPLRAAGRFPASQQPWFDLGTGGGSPAIPLKIARPLLSLTMVESKARKAAFLNEAVRVLNLTASAVEQGRLEDVARRFPGAAQFITVRAVKVDASLLESANLLLGLEGELMLFRPDSIELRVPNFTHVDTIPLGGSNKAHLSSYRRMFHVEHSR